MDSPDIGPGQIVEVREAVELEASVTRLPGPQGGLLNVVSPSMVPLDSEPTHVTITALVHNIRYYSEMADKGIRYHEMYNHLGGELHQARLRAAGLAEAPQGAPQGGPPQGSPIMGPGGPMRG